MGARPTAWSVTEIVPGLPPIRAGRSVGQRRPLPSAERMDDCPLPPEVGPLAEREQCSDDRSRRSFAPPPEVCLDGPVKQSSEAPDLT